MDTKQAFGHARDRLDVRDVGQAEAGLGCADEIEETMEELELDEDMRGCLRKCVALEKEVDDRRAKLDEDLYKSIQKGEAAISKLRKDRKKCVRELMRGGDGVEAGKFWSHVLEGHEAVRESLGKDDMQVLQYVTDMRHSIRRVDNTEEEEDHEYDEADDDIDDNGRWYGIKIELEFATDNPYVSNKVLTKTAWVRSLLYPAASPPHLTGTKIRWTGRQPRAPSFLQLFERSINDYDSETTKFLVAQVRLVRLLADVVIDRPALWATSGSTELGQLNVAISDVTDTLFRTCSKQVAVARKDIGSLYVARAASVTPQPSKGAANADPLLPDFWSMAIQECSELGSIATVHGCDEEPLRYLDNVLCEHTIIEMDAQDAAGNEDADEISIKFLFAANPHHKTREAWLTCTRGFVQSHHVPTITIYTVGTDGVAGDCIDWVDGEDPTIKVKEDGTIKRRRSFFRLFDSPVEGSALGECLDLVHAVESVLLPRAAGLWLESLEGKDSDDEDIASISSDEEDEDEDADDVGVSGEMVEGESNILGAVGAVAAVAGAVLVATDFDPMSYFGRLWEILAEIVA